MVFIGLLPFKFPHRFNSKNGIDLQKNACIGAICIEVDVSVYDISVWKSVNLRLNKDWDIVRRCMIFGSKVMENCEICILCYAANQFGGFLCTWIRFIWPKGLIYCIMLNAFIGWSYLLFCDWKSPDKIHMWFCF